MVNGGDSGREKGAVQLVQLDEWMSQVRKLRRRVEGA